MQKTYLIKIVTKHLQTKFQIEYDKEVQQAEDIHKPIIDYLGKNDMNWEPNPLKYNKGFYITYEELNNGPRQHGVVREETQARV